MKRLGADYPYKTKTHGAGVEGPRRYKPVIHCDQRSESQETGCGTEKSFEGKPSLTCEQSHGDKWQTSAGNQSLSFGRAEPYGTLKFARMAVRGTYKWTVSAPRKRKWLAPDGSGSILHRGLDNRAIDHWLRNVKNSKRYCADQE